MTATRPARPLDVLLAEVDDRTARVVATLEGLDDASVHAPSACPGWTRGHVATHLARNADAVTRLARAALTGERLVMYASEAARTAEIEQGADRPAAKLAADVAASGGRLDGWLRHLVEEAVWLGDVSVETRGGARVDAVDLPFLRLREVAVHHVDLLAGVAFVDLPAPLQLELTAREVDRAAAGPDGVVLRVVSDEGDDLTGGDHPTHTLRGPRAALLGWLTRGTTDEVTADGGDLPTLPSGG